VKPTDILTGEHRVIEQVLDCLAKMADLCTSEGRLEKQPAKDAIAFFRNFADRCHHGKEEVHLFAAMDSRGFPRDGGPTGVMLREHELGRMHVRQMDENVDAAAAGDSEALGQFAEHARSYVELLREHIRKEDHCLFPMANQAFSESDQRALMTAFKKVEAEDMGEGTHQAHVKIANDLADRYGVPRATVGHDARQGYACGHS
jgi:hemerythrin-like domain-containing protein